MNCSIQTMSEKPSNLYIPDYQAWEKFYEAKATRKDQRVSFGFETEKEALKNQQQQDIVVSTDRTKFCDQIQKEPRVTSVVSPTEQTVQQAESVMKKAANKGKNKCSSKKKSQSITSKKSKPQKKKTSGKKKATFSYRTLGDIFNKRK